MLSGVLLEIAINLVPHPTHWLPAVQVGVPWIGYAVARICRLDYPYAYPLYFSFCSVVSMGTLDLAALSDRLVPAAAALAGGLVLVVAVTWSEPPASSPSARVGWVAGVLLAALYVYASMFVANCLLDRSGARVERAAVVRKRQAVKGPSKVYLQWGGHGLTSEPVGERLFQSVQPGDTVCIVERGGALGMAWHTVQLCPYNGGPVAVGRFIEPL
jgi:hypothetical protein